VLSGPNGSEAELARLSALVYGRLAPRPVVPTSSDGGWLPVADLLSSPASLGSLVAAAGPRFGSADFGLVVAQVVREAISVVVTVATELLLTRRLLLDFSAANVLLREGPSGVVVGLRSGSASAPPGDKLVPLFVEGVLGDPLPLGAAPAGPAEQVAAVATLIAAVRRTMRSGGRHLWGSAALAVASVATQVGPAAAPYRDRILRARPDLARTIELVTVPADADGPEVTFPLRRTCCLLLKLPPGDQCGTCSLRPRPYCLSLMTRWARTPQTP